MGSFSLPATRAMELLFCSLIMQSVQETVWSFFFLLLPEGKGGSVCTVPRADTGFTRDPAQRVMPCL